MDYEKRIGLFAAFMGVIGLGTYTLGQPYGEGAMVGFVTNITSEPQECRVWKGEMTPLTGPAVAFSVADPGIVAQLKEAKESMKPTVLRFTEFQNKSPCSANTGLRVTTVEP